MFNIIYLSSTQFISLYVHVFLFFFFNGCVSKQACKIPENVTIGSQSSYEPFQVSPSIGLVTGARVLARLLDRRSRRQVPASNCLCFHFGVLHVSGTIWQQGSQREKICFLLWFSLIGDQTFPMASDSLLSLVDSLRFSCYVLTS